jgi:hypothetical protein
VWQSTKRVIAGMTRAMAMATKKVMATNGDTTGSGYHCPLSSAVAAAVVGKDDKGGAAAYFCMVWW